MICKCIKHNVDIIEISWFKKYIIVLLPKQVKYLRVIFEVISGFYLQFCKIYDRSKNNNITNMTPAVRRKTC